MLQVKHETEERKVRDGLERASQAIGESFRKNDNRNGSLAERITKRLIGTKQMKLCAVQDEQVIVNQVQQFVEKEEPIFLASAGGAMKDKSDEQVPDVAEMMAITTLIELGDAVSEIYSPGISVTLVQEDLGDKYLDIKNSIRVDAYTTRFQRLVESCCSNIKAVNESALLGMSLLDFYNQADYYKPLFYSYLKDDDKDSFQQLNKLGWLGEIPQEMREYYYERARLMGLDPIENLSRMFSSVFTRAKRKPFSNSIRFSFAAPTPGMPTRGGRIFMRTIPRSICSQGIPYWSADGFLADAGDVYYPVIASRHLKNPDRVPGTMMVEGIQIDAALQS